MSYYVYIKHPITGDRIAAVPTGKTRQGQSTLPEAEVKVITPGARIDTLWITRTEIVTPPPPLDTI